MELENSESIEQKLHSYIDLWGSVELQGLRECREGGGECESCGEGEMGAT